MRENIYFQCATCKHRNYVTTKNKKKHQDRMEVRKYCRFCRTHTSHKEGK